mmetsp:Transcript_9416/g.27466  ORF Transcript_9416/g.27466 Transcript_9416/m.27466 type:complete len:250 (+) Transcript_9416:245-994(+)
MLGRHHAADMPEECELPGIASGPGSTPAGGARLRDRRAIAFTSGTSLPSCARRRWLGGDGRRGWGGLLPVARLGHALGHKEVLVRAAPGPATRDRAARTGPLRLGEHVTRGKSGHEEGHRLARRGQESRRANRGEHCAADARRQRDAQARLHRANHGGESGTEDGHLCRPVGALALRHRGEGPVLLLQEGDGVGLEELWELGVEDAVEDERQDEGDETEGPGAVEASGHAHERRRLGGALAREGDEGLA